MTTTIKKEIMAINVNTVYKSVLSILNKEQRGFLTPDEFNKIAREAQMNMLDIAFVEYNRMSNLDTVGRTNLGYADAPSKIKEKIDQFYKTASVSLSAGVGTLPADIYKIIDLTNSDRTLPFELVDKHELPYLLSSPLTKPSTDYPVYYKTTTSAGATSIQVNPTSISSAELDYIKVPNDPRFGYTINATYGTNTYDSNPYVDGGGILGTRTIGIVSDNPTNLSDGGLTINLQNSTTDVLSSSSGTGMNVTITASGNTVTSFIINSAGSGYAIGDVFTISDATMTNGDDIEITLRAEDLYASSTQGSTDFELHPSEEPQLLMQILAFAGVTIKDPQITQLASQSIQANANIKQQ